MSLSLGLDVGGTFLKTVLVDDTGRMVSDHRDRIPDGDLLAFLDDTVDSFRDGASISSIGVGVAGLVRWPEGEFVWGPHVDGLELPVRRHLARTSGLPVMVDNDANLAAYCEAVAGSADGRSHVLMLTLGTGIGGGIVSDGRIFRGRSFAGEVGHMTMVEGGPACECGRRGCWEMFVSGGRLDAVAAELVVAAPHGTVAQVAAGAPPTTAHLVVAAEQGDMSARGALEEAGTWLGRGIADLVVVLDPDVVVIGGTVSQAGDWLLEPARAEIGSRLVGIEHRGTVDVVPARYGALSGAMGAALLAQEETRMVRP